MHFTIFSRKLGFRIRELRQKKGLTQEDMDFGDYGIPLRTFQEVEAGRRNPSIKTLLKIAMRLEVHPRDLLDFSFEEPKKRTKH